MDQQNSQQYLISTPTPVNDASIDNEDVQPSRTRSTSKVTVTSSLQEFTGVMANALKEVTTPSPFIKRTVKIWSNTQMFPKFDFVKYCDDYFQRRVVKETLVDKMSGIAYVTFYDIKDAEVISREYREQQCNQYKKEVEDDSSGNQIQQTGPIRYIQLAEVDDLDFDVDMLSVHGENLNLQTINQIVVDADYKLYDIIQHSEKRSMILLMNTTTHRELFKVLNRISTVYFCAPVKSNVVTASCKSNVNETHVYDYMSKFLNEELHLSNCKIFGKVNILIHTGNNANLKTLMSHKDQVHQESNISLDKYYGCLSEKAYTRYIEPLVRDHDYKINTLCYSYTYGLRMTSISPFNQTWYLPNCPQKFATHSPFGHQIHEHNRNYQICFPHPHLPQNTSTTENELAFKNNHFELTNFKQQQYSYVENAKQTEASLDMCESEMFLLVKTKYYEGLRQKYKNITLQMDAINFKLIFSGSEQYVNPVLYEVKLFLFDHFSTAELNSKDFTDDEIKIFTTNEFYKTVNQMFDQRGKLAYLCQSAGNLKVTYDKQSLSEENIKQLLKENLNTELLPMDELQCIIYESQQWNNYYSELKSKDVYFTYTIIEVDKQNQKLKLVGPIHGFKEMKSEIINFEKNNEIETCCVTFGTVKVKYAKAFLDKSIKEIKKRTNEFGGSIEWKTDKCIVTGLKDGVDLGEKELGKMSFDIRKEVHPLNYSCGFEYLKSNVGQQFLQATGHKHECIIEVSESQNALESPISEFIKSEDCVQSGMVERSQVFIMNQDPYQLHVESYINFIVEKNLEKDSPPSGFIGGQNTWNKVKDIGGFEGQIILTSREFMTGVVILNIICSSEEKILQKYVKSSLMACTAQNCKTLAFTLDAFHDFGITINQWIEIIRLAIAELFNFEKTFLHRIYMCCKDSSLAHESASLLFISENEKKPKKTNATPKVTLTTQQSSSTSKPVQKLKLFSNFASTAKTIIINTTKIKVSYGNIVEKKADVIVTSIQSDLDMTKGFVIAEVLKKGGQTIQDELKNSYPNGIQPGTFAISSAGQLRASSIFHACLGQWDPLTSEHSIKNLVKTMLEEMCKRNYSSLSMPALGTGNLNYDIGITSKIIIGAIKRYVNNNPSSNLKKVTLVIFKQNKNVFEIYTKSLLQQGNNGVSLVTTPLPLRSNTLLNSVSFGKVQVFVVSGDILQQQASAMIIPADKTLNLNFGKVANSVLVSGGQEIQAQLKKSHPSGLNAFEFAKCNTEKLCCKTLYFICLQSWNAMDVENIKQLLIDVMIDADVNKCSSLTLPSIGTGNLSFPIDESKRICIESIKQFASTNPKYLKKIHIVLHPSDTTSIQAYAKGLKVERNTWTKFVTMWPFGKADETPVDANANACYQHGSITLSLQISDITLQKCEAIMCAVAEDLDFDNSGSLCKTIIEMCPDNFATTCKRKENELHHKGFILVTQQDWKLMCKYLFLLNLNRYQDCWGIGVYDVLDKAEEMGLSTIALPLFDADDYHIKDIRTAIHSFGMSKPKSLFNVRLIVNSRDLFNKVDRLCRDQISTDYLSNGVNITILYKNDELKKQAMKELISHLKCNHSETTVTSHSIEKFTSSHVYRLQKIGHHSMISVKVDKNKVNMSGFGQLNKVQNEISKIEAEVKNSFMSNISTNNRIQWQYKENDDNVDFCSMLNLQLEAAYNDGKTTTDITLDGESYEINFENMTAENQSTGSGMIVIRRDVLAEGEPLPEHWDFMSDKDTLRLVMLDPEEDEYHNVENYYKENGAVGEVVKIERVQNRALYQQYAAKKREMCKRNTDIENEMQLFHGSSHESIEAINKTGFNRSYCGKNGTWYGEGVYFSQSSKYSEEFTYENDENLRKLYVANVLVGRSVETKEGDKHPPTQPGFDIPYDSGKAPDDRKEGIYVIFHDSQAYPAYLITFTV